MKKFFKNIISMFACVLALNACTNEVVPFASSVQLSQSEVSVDGMDPQPVTVNVTADGEWYALSSVDWVKVEPQYGNGNGQISIVAEKNLDSFSELAGPRKAFVSICCSATDLSQVLVLQKGENGLDTQTFFSKVAKTEEVNAGSYLIVFNEKDGKAEALRPFDGDYSYMKTADVEIKDGKIEQSNSVLAIVFEAVEGQEGKYLLKMSNGKYIYHDGAHNSFQATTDKSKAKPVSVTIKESGEAIITAETGSMIGMDPKYGTGGFYDSLDGKGVPALYKDAKPATDEVLSVPAAVKAAGSQTSVKFNVNSNKTWSVRCHDDWVKSFTKSGEGKGEIEVTFDKYEGAEPRTAELQVIGETTNIIVKLTQAPVAKATTVAALLAQIESKNKDDKSIFEAQFTEASKVKVSYINYKSIFIEDETAGMMLYADPKGFPGLKVGATLTGNIFGQGYFHYDVKELSSLEGATFSGEGAVEPKVLTLAELNKDFDRYINCLVKVNGVEITDGIYAGKDADKKGEFKVGETKFPLYLKNTYSKADLKVGFQGDITGIPTINYGDNVFGFWDEKHFNKTGEVAPEPEVPTFEGDGKSPATAYTVADVIKYFDAGMDSNAEVWVKGPIAGYFASGKPVLLTDLSDVDKVQASNMGLGTNDQFITVQLSSRTAPREALNLKDHPENLGKTVAVKGKIQAYFNIAGVKSLSAFELY